MPGGHGLPNRTIVPIDHAHWRQLLYNGLGGKTPSSNNACRCSTRWRMLISSTRTVTRPIIEIPVSNAPAHWKCSAQTSLRGWNRRDRSPETGSRPAILGPLWLLHGSRRVPGSPMSIVHHVFQRSRGQLHESLQRTPEASDNTRSGNLHDSKQAHEVFDPSITRLNQAAATDVLRI